MNERSLALDESTMKVGLLMESAQAHQKLAESQLEKLRAHTADLDGVVRDEIRRTLVDELQMLTAESTRATRALEKIRRAATIRGSFISMGAAAVCVLAPIAVARWTLPTPQDIALLRARRDELTAQVAKLKELGGRIDWRRCGDAPRLCVKVDRKAPTYGDHGDYYVIEGY
jgi:malate synthase